MSNFKVIFLGIFLVGAILGMLVFSGVIKFGSDANTTNTEGTVVIWGTLPSTALRDFFDKYNLENPKSHINYEEKNPDTFTDTLIEAIASGKSPDLVLLPSNNLWRLSNKLTVVPFASLPQRTFSDTFVSGANIFLTSTGTMAIPFAADPLVMYYNRDLLEGEGIAKAPTNWKTFTETIPSLTIKEKDLTLRQSGAALGTFKNITHAKDLLALLFLQTNNSFVTNGADGIKTHFGAGADQAEENSAENAVNFYMGFSDPSKDVYTWNSGMPRDREAFIQSSLAYYFGYASDLPEIRRTNPNLHFDVAIPPQSGFTTPLTTGIFYGLAMPKGAPNNLLSYSVATTLAGNAVQKNLALNSAKLTLMPVRRDVIADSPKDDPYLDLFYKATLVMHSWFDPDPKVSNVVFGTLISDIMSGALRTDLALAKAGSSLISQTSSSQ